LICFTIGDSARAIFLQSKLNIEALGKVWSLVDSVGAGKISQNQFMVAMVIIARLRSGQLSSVPLSIPQSLWNSIVTVHDSSPLGSKASSVASVTLPAASVTLPAASVTLPAASPRVEEVPWIIPDADQKQFSTFFDKLDKSKTGFVTGIQIIRNYNR
jgi:epidermal growth factor receptor substrate 15